MSTRTTGISEFGRLLSNVFGWGSRSAGPAITRAADDVVEAEGTSLTKKGLMKDAIARAKEMREASRTGVLRRPTMQAGNLVSPASQKINEKITEEATKAAEKLNPNLDELSDRAYNKAIQEQKNSIIEELGIDVDTMAVKAAKVADRGGLGKQATKAGGKFAINHPFYTAAGVGGGLYGLSSSDNEIVKSTFDTGAGLASGVLGTAFSAVNGGLNIAANGLSPIFEGATGLLEYAGVDPKYAKIAVGLGTFFALKSAIGMFTEQIGLNKLSPTIGGLGVIIAAGIMAYKIADSAGAFDSTADNKDKLQATAALSAPAPAMP